MFSLLFSDFFLVFMWSYYTSLISSIHFHWRHYNCFVNASSIYLSSFGWFVITAGLEIKGFIGGQKGLFLLLIKKPSESVMHISKWTWRVQQGQGRAVQAEAVQAECAPCGSGFCSLVARKSSSIRILWEHCLPSKVYETHTCPSIII